MHMGSKTAISTPLIVYLLSCWSGISSANILTDIPKSNPLNIYWDPAPSPEDGPPASANALRDPSTLPAEIGGIVGAYLLCVCIVGIALVLIGRRLRHTVQKSAKALDIEMVEPGAQAYGFDPSPISPIKQDHGSRNFSWPSPEKNDRNPYIFPTNTKSPRTPVAGRDPYVDPRIVEADREMLDRNLEDLYAHVMEQEEAKAAGVDLKELPPPLPLQGAGPLPSKSPQRQNTPPKKTEKSKPASLNFENSKASKSHSRTSSIISSIKSPKRKGIRGMRISSPMQTPLSATYPHSPASDEEPLSPRYYSPPPPPPVPKDQVPYSHHTRNESSGPTISPSRSIAEKLSQADPHNRSITHLHRPNQSQASIQSSRGDPISATSTTSATPLFSSPQHAVSIQQKLQPPQGRQLHVDPPSNNSSVRELPFRQFEPALQSPSFAQQTTKTTVLERTSPLSPGLNTAGQPRTPWTANAVPYSPYQPFTPMMPITPRLVTKEDRKAMKKREGRTPVLEMIKSEDELWDSGY